MQFLSLILFLPTFFVMGALFLLFPRETAGGRRRTANGRSGRSGPDVAAAMALACLAEAILVWLLLR